MTTVAYCAVSPNGRTFEEQMYMRAEIVPKLRELTDAVHAEGPRCRSSSATAATSAGTRLCRAALDWAVVPNQRVRADVGIPFARAMTAADIAATVEEFATAAALAVRAKFDAVELHLGHGYLLSQFLCPATNRRRDQWGGSLDNRMRLRSPCWAGSGRSRAGLPDSGEDQSARRLQGRSRAPGVHRRGAAVGSRGGEWAGPQRRLHQQDTLLSLSWHAPAQGNDRGRRRAGHKRSRCAFSAATIIKEYPFQEMFFLEEARRCGGRSACRWCYSAGSSPRQSRGRDAQKFDFVAMGRALIADPDLIEPDATRRGDPLPLHLVQQVSRRNRSQRRPLRARLSDCDI